jgi:pentapeptide MXKDX repeat protein
MDEQESQKTPSTMRRGGPVASWSQSLIFRLQLSVIARNKGRAFCVVRKAADVAFDNRATRMTNSMTIKNHIGLGLSAAVLSLSLALAPAAFAQDKMGKDDGMKKDSMSKDAMKKDDGMMKKDGMKKDDAMAKDGMKKDDGMKKN